MSFYYGKSTEGLGMIIDKLVKSQTIHPPKWLPNNTMFLTITGSDAYGVTSGESDVDIYGWCIPPKEDVFPHLRGEINGFGNHIQRFEQWSEHHVRSLDGKVEYDFTVFNVVKYFQLCMDNNPNMIDTLFTPRRCVVHSTAWVRWFVTIGRSSCIRVHGTSLRVLMLFIIFLLWKTLKPR
jgi:hypothetical protein